MEIPSAHPEMFGSREVGVLVRMKFLDAGTTQAALTDGLPVTVRFDNRWNNKLPERVASAMRNGWTSVHSLIENWRS